VCSSDLFLVLPFHLIPFLSKLQINQKKKERRKEGRKRNKKAKLRVMDALLTIFLKERVCFLPGLFGLRWACVIICS